MSKPFRFKQFSVSQEYCAMKIGTDSVLLGAWARLDSQPNSILDIGAGTGVLALMLAQRSGAELIDAIEIDDAAYEQCVGNFEASDWGDRLFCYHASLDEFTEEIEDQYDLIISNPPFYTDTFKTENEERNKARFEDAMPFTELLKSVSKLLSPTGQFNLVIPFSEENSFIELAAKEGLYPSHILQVRGQESSPVKRSLICFTFEKQTIKTQELIIEIARHQYTKEYTNLTKDFYLKL
ncbi:tRNA (adenine-N6)-methyltransferase [Formosa sp. Hel1_33_131]|uniref:tRNA1(Val) (adenine(37)-N6)-methyltransferase n=1 Tax=Formosa sp. Hel1_33_131 TaxID=1336794 RepID=UPI00084E3791|nr:methyltransferase [Formosa sp. Hel1_33_131]AOR28995.1 tRNA (adenine-N6)-methyltransferase [Formosa sp. Hel1_33_131]